MIRDDTVVNETIDNNINEYYRLKSKYDSDIEKNKKKILNNKTFSIKEKKSEFKQLKPKCVNCGKPGGTTFASVVNKNGNGNFRELRAFCKAVEPCGLNINIAVGNFENINDLLKMIEETIHDSKNEIINDKNKLLFGLMSTEDALENFESQKNMINDFTSLLENYLNIYIKITDDPEMKTKLVEDLEKSYILIQQIKTAIKNFDETNGMEFIRSASNIYVNELKPLLNIILKLTYKENKVVFNESEGTYHLIQKKYSIKDMEINNDKYETVNFDTNIQSKTSRKQRLNIVNSSSEEELEKSTTTTSNIIGTPTINKETGAVTWSNKNYQGLWSKMSKELKTALLSDKDWLQEFMDNCVKSKLTGKKCEFINPSNLIIPPQLIEDGMYDFGNEVYNKIFNKFDESYKTTLLTLFTVSPEDGSKNYTMMENTLSDIVKKELNFDNEIL
jgi:hypothetical protein